MKAVVYDKSVPDSLVFREVDKPVPGASEVLIKIHAVSVNAADYRSMRMGIIPRKKIFGADIAGEIEAVGTGVTRFKKGDQVFGDLSGCGFGGFAEFVCAPEKILASKPVNISYPDTAAVPMAALTALQALRDQGNLLTGQKVLIYGAGGGVGTFAIQLARILGGQVTAVCSSNNVETARSLGADRVINYAEMDILRSNEHFDLILAVNGSRSVQDYRRALSSNGRCVVVGGDLRLVVITLLFGKLLSGGGKQMRSLAAKQDTTDLAWVIKLVEEGKLKPVIDRTFPLQEASAAMRYAGQGHAKGKVVIKVIDD